MGGTSLSAPAWAGLLALANQGRVAAGEATLNSSTQSDTQQALYMLPQNDYNVIASGTNGYSAQAGYNLVTGLGTPVANLLVPDLIAYQGAGTTYSGPAVAGLQNAGLVNTGASDDGPMDVFSVFDAITVTDAGLGSAHAQGSHLEASTLRDTTNTAGQADRLLTMLQASSQGLSKRAAGSALAPPQTRLVTSLSARVDELLGALPDTDSDDTLIVDLAFEQVSSGVPPRRRPRD